MIKNFESFVNDSNTVNGSETVNEGFLNNVMTGIEAGIGAFKASKGAEQAADEEIKRVLDGATETGDDTQMTILVKQLVVKSAMLADGYSWEKLCEKPELNGGIMRNKIEMLEEIVTKYKDDDRVASISAFLNPTDTQISETFFLRYFACWGWATWKRAWQLFNPDSRELLKRIRWKTNEFNIGGTGPFYGILYCDKVGLNDSWAVRFYASCFLANKLHLFPYQTMAIQSGMDGTGTHSGISTTYSNMKLSQVPILLSDIPVMENQLMYQAFSRFYGKGRKNTVKVLFQRLKSFVRRLLGVDYR